MTESSCIFCKIVSKQIPAAIIAENDQVLVIKDLHPKAPTHYLIIPKIHVQDVQSLLANQLPQTAALFGMAQELSCKADPKNPQHFRLVINSGYNAGQRVFHLHMHYLVGSIDGEV